MSVASNYPSDEQVYKLQTSLAAVSELSKDVISIYKENSF